MDEHEVLLRCRVERPHVIENVFADLFGLDSRQESENWVWGENLNNEMSAELRGILALAQELVNSANRSISEAQESKSPDRRRYEIARAQTHLIELNRMTVSDPRLEIVHLEEVMLLIAQIEQETVALQLKGKLDGASHGWWLEKKGKVREAIRAYESFVERASVKPFIYKRLAVLYRKLKSVDDEIRVLKEALKNVPESSKKHREWFRERLEKLKSVK